MPVVFTHVDQVLLREREWLARLRWVDRGEVAWLIALPLALLLWAGLLLALAAWPTVLQVAASHAVLGACTLALAPRGRLPLWCGLVLLSMLHFAVFAAAGYAHLQLLATAYLVLACSALCWCTWLALRLLRLWRSLANCNKRDDFRWLITQAPLAVRWRAWCVLRHGRPG